MSDSIQAAVELYADWQGVDWSDDDLMKVCRENVTRLLRAAREAEVACEGCGGNGEVFWTEPDRWTGEAQPTHKDRCPRQCVHVKRIGTIEVDVWVDPDHIYDDDELFFSKVVVVPVEVADD